MTNFEESHLAFVLSKNYADDWKIIQFGLFV
jgi:hypothetical protein